MSFDDLFGDDKAPAPQTQPVEKRPIGRPKGSKASRTAADEQKDELNLGMQDTHHILAGVSITWLSRIFRMTPDRVKDALANCKPIGTGRNGGSVYDVQTAARYLVEPVKDVEDFLRGLDSKRLPTRMQEGYWNARIKEMKAKVMAGELWPTGRVQEVLGNTFLTIKSTVQLWADTIEEDDQQQGKGDMLPEHRNAIIALSDKLLDDIHHSLLKQDSEQSTESWVSELDGN